MSMIDICCLLQPIPLTGPMSTTVRDCIMIPHWTLLIRCSHGVVHPLLAELIHIRSLLAGPPQ